MNTAVTSSTFLLTLLLMVGLVFFIRASVKDRTEQVQLITEEPEESLLSQLQEYFDRRTYRVLAVDADTQEVTFEGFVRPSWFLAFFLTFLAAVGMLCLALVLSMTLSGFTTPLLGLVLLSPLAGVFYWQKAGRPEQVSLKVEKLNPAHPAQSLITVRAHRDEVLELRQALKLQEFEAE